MNNSYNSYGAQGYGSGAYAGYGQGYSTGYDANYSYGGQYVTSNSVPPPPGEEYPQQGWGGSYAQSTQSASTTTSQNQNAAVANEMKQQKNQLMKQREDYVQKLMVLRRELDILRDQKQDLMTSNSPPRDLDSIVKENNKLQDEIQTKMKAINNVIEMLSSIIKDGLKVSDIEAQLTKPATPKEQKSSAKQPAADNSGAENLLQHFNYIHYDPELHWCRLCEIFPKTAKEFLQHLQTKKHQEKMEESDVGDNTPWHKLPQEPEMPHYEGAPKKRIPIKGLQFFIAAPAWYCKLCDSWIGDLHCASQHLKSQTHYQNYMNFVEQNPHWEMEWLKDREKSLSQTGKQEDSSDSDDSKSKKKRHHRKSDSKDKKKKRKSKKRKRHSSDSSSSSSSSDSSSDDETFPSDKSKSIRVAMRNVKVDSIMKEDLTGKWEMLGRLVEEHKKKEREEMEREVKKSTTNNDPLISQWMTVSQPQEKEKYLLDSLKDRMKQKQKLEEAKFAEMERKRKEKEKKEKEEAERRDREAREAREREERERKERERREFERITDKDRDQVKFKQSLRDKNYYRKRKTPSPSPDRREHSRETSEQEHYQRRSPPRKSSYENGRSRSRSTERHTRRSSERSDKKPPGPPSYKRFPFIGRMPLFKNKKPEEKVEKEIKKEEYDKPRLTRFQPGNLARAFIPDPEVVCFPKLSSYPELTFPPPPPKAENPPPPPPKITEKPPPAPKITKKEEKPQPPPPLPPPEFKNEDFDPSLYEDPSEIFYPPAEFAPPPPSYDYGSESKSHDMVPHAHTMPLQPPPLPPGEDDLALLGISADDMAAQTF